MRIHKNSQEGDIQDISNEKRGRKYLKEKIKIMESLDLSGKDLRERMSRRERGTRKLDSLNNSFSTHFVFQP